MPTPQHPQRAAPGADAPVNIAPPNWQCPHCRSTYRTDLQAATACAQAGPAPEVTAGTPVLVLPGGSGRPQTARPVFGATEVGPVRAETVDGKRRHRRDVLVAGQQVSAERLAAATPAADGLLIVGPTRPGETAAHLATPGLSSWGVLATLFVGHRGFDGHRDPGVRVWVDEPRHSRPTGWWAPPTAPQREALDVVTAGLLERVRACDPEQLANQIRAAYVPSHRSYRSGMTPADLAGPEGGLMLAQAHGAPNHIWALRWLTAHLDRVVTWQAQTLQAWAAGEGGPIPGAAWVRVPDALPKSPGKRRLAVMAPYGQDYRRVGEAVLAELTTDAPVNPVPGLGDVAETVHTTPKEGADHV